MGRSKNSAKNGGVRNGNGVGNGSSASANGNGAAAAQDPPSAPQSPPPPHPSQSRFSINLSVVFILLTFLISAVVAFSIGWTSRLILLSHFGLHPYTDVISPTNAPTNNLNDDDAKALALPKSGGMSKKSITSDADQTMSGKKNAAGQLPAPTIIEGKEVPFTTYASKTFQMEGAATSNTLHIDRTSALIMSRSKKEFDGGPDFQNVDNTAEEETVAEGGDDDGWVQACEEKSCSRGKEKKETNTDNTPEDGHNDDSDGLHLPAGQHLLVDIKDVDTTFLNSEELLATAMIELTNESKLTLLSYHCHSLVPIGVSCAGVLLESHVAFHTWPLEGVITMDLFTCGGGLLVPLLPLVENLFAVPQVPGEGMSEEDIVQPTLLWSHKLRGFREGFAPGYFRSKNPLDGSLGRYVLGKLDFDLKKPLLSTKTEIQSVNIYEVMEPKSRDVNSYHKSLLPGVDDSDENGTSYELMHPEYFGPDKILFLDGIIQSTLYGDAPYHESIVHPGMISHPSPKRVAIIGGGEGATLREVLKHKSVEEVVILEIDRELVEICAEYMPEWSDCSDIQGSDAKQSCFEDSKARIIYADAFKWFIDNYGKDGGNSEEEQFDVIIMDALDPNTSVEIAGGLYEDTSFVDLLSSSLTEQGVFVVQMGKSKMVEDPADEIGRFKDTALLIQALEKSGFGSIHTYDEGHSHFYMPWAYLVALKDYKSRASWYRTAPEIQIELQHRLHGTRSGKPILRYFDAATMVSYQLPSKAQETTYCRKDEEPWECEEFVGIHPDYIGLPASEYVKVGKSTIPNAGRGLFATKDIESNESLALDETWKAFHFPPLTWSVIERLLVWAEANENTIPFVEDELASVYSFAEGYGHGAVLMGSLHMAVDSGVMLFMNHGCNNTSNYGYIFDENAESFTEANADVANLTKVVENLINKASAYSPVFERNLKHALNSGDYALREIKEGEEILTDYLAFVGDPESWKESVMSLRGQCSGNEIGTVTEYEGYNS